jgi:hypothetical protein
VIFSEAQVIPTITPTESSRVLLNSSFRLNSVHEIVVIFMGPDPEPDNIHVFPISQSPVMITDVYCPDGTFLAEIQ